MTTTDQPLTDTEAAVLRALGLGISLTYDHLVERGLARTGTVPCMTDAGRAALAAYDAEKRRRISVEAMRKCRDVLARGRLSTQSYSFVITCIDDLIAKESTDG